jgi:hypothetical protein
MEELLAASDGQMLDVVQSHGGRAAGAFGPMDKTPINLQIMDVTHEYSSVEVCGLRHIDDRT